MYAILHCCLQANHAKLIVHPANTLGLVLCEHHVSGLKRKTGWAASIDAACFPAQHEFRVLSGSGFVPISPQTLSLIHSQALKLRKAVPALNELYKAGGGYRHNREGASTDQYEAKLLRVRRDLQELLRIVIEHDDRALQDIPRAFRRTRQDEPSEVRA